MNPEERDQNLTENALIHVHKMLSAKFRRQLSCKYSVMMGENAMFSQLSQFRQKTQQIRFLQTNSSTEETVLKTTTKQRLHS